MRNSLFALVLLALASIAAAESDDSAQAREAQGGSVQDPADPDAAGGLAESETDHRWHLPRKRDRGIRLAPPGAEEPDWNPLSGAAQALKELLPDTGIRLDLDAALYSQHASETVIGDANLGTSAWQSVGDLQFLRHEKLGTSFVQWAFLGSTGLNYDTGDRSLSGNVASISDLNANVFPDHAALEELFFKHVSLEGKLIALAGRVAPSFYFDTNRVANDDFRQFFAFALSNNLSLPFSTYGGIGALVRYAPSKDLYIMAAADTAVNVEPWAFWRSADDGDWNQFVEIGLTRSLPYLGKGQYRITPWHSHRFGADGWGFGFNLDQELGFDRLVAFFRFGFGDDDVTAVERFVSGGLALEHPFGRKNDLVSVGVAWSDPSPGEGFRKEMLLEFYYRLKLSPSLALTPDLQIVLDPANDPKSGSVFIGGVRLEMRL